MNLDDFLIEMAKIGDTKAVKYALEHGANIHAYDDCALKWASNYGNYGTVLLLLDHGANAEVLNE